MQPHCQFCGASYSAAASFCPQCAAKVVRGADDSAEWRQITVLFCDLAGASALAKRLDPEDFYELLQAHQSLCAEAVDSYGGQIAQYLSEGVLAYFGYPVAHEDDAQRAVAAALAMREAATTHPRLAATAQHPHAAIRVGVHTGAVVVGEMGSVARREQLAIGDTLNLAARVLGAAADDCVVVTEQTQRLLGDAFEVVSLGETALRGFQNTQLYRVLNRTQPQTARNSQPPREQLPFIGRDRELSFLLERWQAASTGQPASVLIAGDPGIGKSRLVRALRQQIRRDAVRCVSCHCTPQSQNTVLYPLLEMLERELAITRELSAHDKRARVEQALRAAGVTAPAAAERLARLLAVVPSLSGEASGESEARQLRRDGFDLLLTLLMHLARERPLLIVVEDVQWCDGSTREFLELVIAQRSWNVLLLLTCRLDARVPLTASHQLVLDRLSETDARRLVESVPAERTLPVAVVEQILAKADGIPLYLEEITKALAERRDAEAMPASIASIPATLRDSLTARLDRLGNSKTVLQLAAALGRSFRFDLLLALSELDETELRAQLGRLIAAELLVYPDDRSREQLSFRHALVHEAAYSSLLRSTRQSYHARALQTLTEQFPELAAAQPELLAQHSEAAGQLEQATFHWQQVARRALDRAAHLEVEQACSKALALLASLPPSDERDRREVMLRAYLGIGLRALRGYADPMVESNYNQAYALCQKLGDVPAEVVYGIWTACLVQSDVARTAGIARQLQQLSAASPAAAVHAIASYALGVRGFYLGQYAAARSQLQTCLAQAEPALTDPNAPFAFEAALYGMVYLAWTQAALGCVGESLALWHAATTRADALAHPYARAIALHAGQMLALDVTGDLPHARALALRQLEISDQHELVFFRALASVHLGTIDARLEHADGGIERVRQGGEQLRAMGNRLAYPYAQKCLAQALLATGRAREASHVATQTLTYCEGKLAAPYVPMLLGVRAQAAEQCASYAEAEHDYVRAIAILDTQAATHAALELTLPLARMLRDNGRLQAARERLAHARGLDRDDYPTHTREEAQQLQLELGANVT